MTMDGASGYPRTIYVTGAARSGSTLLGEVLGAQPRILNIGEISLFWRDAHRGNLCACGRPIPECELWSRALAEVEERHGVTLDACASLARTRARLARTSRPMELRRLLRSDPANWPSDVRRLVAATTTLVSSAASTAGANTVVDTSKTVPALLFLDLCGARYDIVHLIRRPEAVASSTFRSRSVRRGNADSKPPGGSLATGVSRWAWSNACGVVAPKVASPRDYQRFHYEAFTEDPEGSVAALCTSLGVETDPTVVQGHRVSLPGISHAAVGNPSRGSREITVSEDNRWRQELTPLQARLISGATAPLRKFL